MTSAKEMKDQFFEAESARQQKAVLDADGLDEVEVCPKKIGFGFHTYVSEKQLRLHTQVICQSTGVVFGRNNDLRCWGCPSCGLTVGNQEVSVLAEAAVASLEELQESFKPKKKGVLAWLWRIWPERKKMLLP